MIRIVSTLLLTFYTSFSFAWTTPVLSSPANGAVVYTGVTLDWSSVINSQMYHLQVDTTPLFNSPVLYQTHKAYINSSSSNTDTEQFMDNLFFGKTYYWRVRAYITGDTSAWSTSRNFITRNDVSLSSPTSGSDNWTGLTLDWSSHWGVDYYDLQVDTVNTFNSPVLISYSKVYINSNSSNTDTEQWLEDLFFGKTYYWRVRVRNAVDTSEWSSVWVFNTKNYVNLVSPTSGSDNWTGLTLDWSAHWGVDFYDLQVDTVSTFNSPVLISYSKAYINSNSSNTDTEQWIEDLFFGKTYYWRVRVRNAVATSEWSSFWVFNTKNYVNLVSPTSGSDNWTGLTLDWSAHWGVDFYDLQVDTVSTFNSPVLISYSKAYINSNSSNTDTEQWIEDLFFGKTYYWRVRVRNAVATSEWSSVWTFHTKNYVNLTSPTTGSDNWTGLTLDWSSHWGVDFYDLQVDTVSTFNSPVLISYSKAYINSNSSNTDTEQWIEDLFFGKTYYWRVRVRNAVATSEWSSVWTFNTKNYVNLTSPTTGSDNWTGLTLDWSAHWGVDFYDLQVDDVNTFNSPSLKSFSKAYVNSNSTNTDTEQWIEDLYFGKTYYWRVRVRNAVDTSSWSSVWTFNTKDFVTLVSPNNGQVNVSVAGITLDWYAHWGVDKYQLEIDTINLFNSVSLVHVDKTYINTSSSNTDTYQSTGALLTNQVYFWRVRTINAVDTSAWTTRSFTTGSNPVLIPDIPVLVSPVNGATIITTSVILDWNASTNATSYQYMFDTDQNFATPLTATILSTDVSVTDLNMENETYYWKVRALHGTAIFSDWSEVRSFTTMVYVPEPQLISPANNAVYQPGSNLELVWNEVSGADNYTYQYSTDNSFTINVTEGNTSSVSFTIPEPGFQNTYYWRVKAFSGSHSSIWSDVWTFNTDIEMPSLISPLNGALQQSFTNLLVNWGDADNATAYTVEYSTDENFVNNVNSQSTNLSEFSIGELTPYTQYFWRVKSVNDIYSSDWSAVWSFTTEIFLQAPQLVSPTNGSLNQPYSNLNLIWESVEPAENYLCQYSTDNTFTNNVFEVSTENLQMTITNLEPATDYYWRVKASAGIIESAWSAVWSFTTLSGIYVRSVDSPEFQVFPNPAMEFLTISGQSNTKAVTVKICNALGMTIKTFQLPGNCHQMTINVSNLQSGSYIIRFEDDNTTIKTMKLFIK